MARSRSIKIFMRSKYGGNELGYNPKTEEYIYYHRGEEMWREQALPDLYEYVTRAAEEDGLLDDEFMEEQFEVYHKYSEGCEAIARLEMGGR